MSLCIVFVTQARQTIRVGVFDNKPIVFKDSDGKIRGFAIDLLENIAAQNDWDIEYRFDAWSNQLPALENGELDLLVGIAYSDERAERFDFSAQTAINNWGVVLQAENTKFTSLQDLVGKRVALMKKSIHSTSFIETMRSFNFTFTIVDADDYQSALDAVAQGKADAVVVNRVFSLLHGQKSELKETGIIFNPVEVRFAAPKGKSAEVLAGIDYSLSNAKKEASSYYYRALNKWLGNVSSNANFKWVFWVIIVAVTLLALVLFYNYMLSKQVKARTLQLARSERRYKLAQEAAHIGSWEWDIKHNQIYWSDNIAAMFGLRVGQFDGKYESYLAMLEEEDREIVIEAVNNALSNNQGYNVEHKIVWPDGSEHWLSGKGELQRDKEGNPARMVGIVQDITQKWRTENALRQSEKQYRNLINSTQEGIWVIDENNITTFANPAMERILGCAAGEMIDKPLFGFMDEQGKRIAQENVERRKQGIAEQHDFEFIRKDGKRIYTTVVTSPVIDGDVYKGAIAGVIDITARVEAENTLANSKAEFEAIFNSISDVCVYADEARHIVMVNPAVKQVFGYTPDELVGKKTEILYADKQDFEEQGKRQFSKETNVKNANYEMRYRRKDGSIFVGDTLGTKVFDAQGNILGLLGIIRDVTERHEAEAELQAHRYRLEELVKERTQEYENINKELEAFSYSVSHDLRAPLRAIDGFSEALREDYEGLLDVTGKEYIQRVRGAAQRMSLLIDDLLHLSRVSRSGMEMHEVDISQTVTESIQRHLESYPGKNVQYNIQPGLKVKADKRLLEIVINNLIDNAIKYSQNKKQSVIEFGCQQNNGDRVFFVKDNGAGFDMRFVKKLFTPFQRLHNPAEFEGTGVGLATVKRIITRHGGRVWAEAEEGKGATFHFTLGPASQGA